MISSKTALGSTPFLAKTHHLVVMENEAKKMAMSVDSWQKCNFMP
jgi:hypothetical protein